MKSSPPPIALGKKVLLAALLGSIPSPSLWARGPDPVAILTSIEGTAEVQRRDRQRWQEARPFIWLFEGDRLRAGPQSKAFVVTDQGIHSITSQEKVLISVDLPAYKTRSIALKLGKTMPLNAVRSRSSLMLISPRGKGSSLRPPLLWLGARPRSKLAIYLSTLDGERQWSSHPKGLATEEGTSCDGEGRTQVALPYPENWPDLEPGRPYVWQVAADDRLSEETPFLAPTREMARALRELNKNTKGIPDDTRDFAVATFLQEQGAIGDALRHLWTISSPRGEAWKERLCHLYSLLGVRSSSSSPPP